mmetsp:Transcript_16313/g.48685  ORF Transcript_16313/g.48685 Transcript_16313/m.48685 type:complete len:393 (-) Transcript_16313:35-1213(-)
MLRASLRSELRRRRRRYSSLPRAKPYEPSKSVSTLILLRHGESVWNGSDPRFTGWCDIPLTVRGRVEAVAAGQLLRSRGFPADKVDVAFTSDLQRAHETCELALASMAGADQDSWNTERIRRDARLNERHYGSLQGWRKNDPELIQGFGADLLVSWRRSMHAAPPPMTDAHPHYRPPPAPTTESLYDCQKRVVECWSGPISHALFEDDTLPTAVGERTVCVVAHSNTIRALMAVFDEVADDLVPSLHVPNSVPILYRFDPATRKPVSTLLETASGGSHARWLLSPANHGQVQKALTSGGMLTRAMFESIDVGRTGELTAAQLEQGIRALLDENPEERLDCVVVGVAKKIIRECHSADERITLHEFETRAAAAVHALRHKDEVEFQYHEGEWH